MTDQSIKQKELQVRENLRQEAALRARVGDKEYGKIRGYPIKKEELYGAR